MQLLMQLLVCLIFTASATAENTGSAEPMVTAAPQETCPLDAAFFFVYGSLRPDDPDRHPWQRSWLAGSTKMKRARVFGGEMRAGYFASVQLSNNNKYPIITGWLISFPSNIFEEKLHHCDMIEGVPHLYQREMTKATLLDSNVTVLSWIYTRDSDGPVVKSGDWIKYQQQLQL